MAKKRQRETAPPKPVAEADSSSQDWIDQLVRASTSGGEKLLNKNERKAHRESKKRQRMESKVPKRNNSHTADRKTDRGDPIDRTSTRRLKLLSAILLETLNSLHDTSGKHPRPFQSLKSQKVSRTKGWTSESVQPPSNYYGGIGLARQSLFLSFTEHGFFPRLEEEFNEHIPGFFGKQRTKAMKKQASSGMLWRKLLDQKNGVGVKVNGRKHSSMSPEERVEAMIRSNMI